MLMAHVARRIPKEIIQKSQSQTGAGINTNFFFPFHVLTIIPRDVGIE